MADPITMPVPTQHRLPKAPRLRALTLLLFTLAGPALAQQDGSRQRPPVDNACPPNHLTLYGGSVRAYRRHTGRTEIRIRTDWDTTETVVLVHPGTDDPSRWFLIDRRPFQSADWPRIEKAPGQLRDGMRAAAWVCDDGRNALVDWQPLRQP